MFLLGPVVAKTHVVSPVDLVWRFLAEPALREYWWPDLSVEMRLGASVRESWREGDMVRDARGTVDTFIPGLVLGFTWRDGVDEDATKTSVLITLRDRLNISTGERSTDVTVTETGFGAGANPAERHAASLAGWQQLLAAYAEACEAAGPEQVSSVPVDANSPAVAQPEKSELCDGSAQLVESVEPELSQESVSSGEPASSGGSVSPAEDVAQSVELTPAGSAPAGSDVSGALPQVDVPPQGDALNPASASVEAAPPVQSKASAQSK